MSIEPMRRQFQPRFFCCHLVHTETEQLAKILAVCAPNETEEDARTNVQNVLDTNKSKFRIELIHEVFP